MIDRPTRHGSIVKGAPRRARGVVPRALLAAAVLSGGIAQLAAPSAALGTVTLSASINAVATPGITEYNLPRPAACAPSEPRTVCGARPAGVTSAAGDLWFVERDGGHDTAIEAPAITRFDPTTHQLTRIPLAAGASPRWITTSPDGKVWLTEQLANEIASVDPATNALTEYPVPTHNGGPHAVAILPGASPTTYTVWFTECHYCGTGGNPSGNKIGRLDPGTGQITEFGVPGGKTEPDHLAAGPDGNIWFTQVAANKIVKMTPTGSMTSFVVPTAGSAPHSIVGGPDGNLWFVEQVGNKIATLNPATGAITEYPLPTPGEFPHQISVGPDGAIWFTEINNIGRITTGGAITEIPLAVNDAFPTSLTAGPDGAVWFGEFYTDRIGRITTSATTTSYGASVNLPTNTGPAAVTLGPSSGGNPTGAIWYTGMDNDTVGRVDLSTHAVDVFPFAPHMGMMNMPCVIAAGPDGNMWVTLAMSNMIAKMSSSGLILAEYMVPTHRSDPHAITGGPDGNVWFTEHNVSKVARITPAGVITEFRTPTLNSFPDSIISGPDGNVWFTELAKNIIAKIDPVTGNITEYTIPTADTHPHGLTTGADGLLWFTEERSPWPAPTAIASLNPLTGQFNEYKVMGPDTVAHQITPTADGNLWVTEQSGRVGRFNQTTKTIDEFPLGPLSAGPAGITTAPDGSFWYAKFGSDQLGSLTASPTPN